MRIINIAIIHFHLWSCTVISEECFILPSATAPPKKPPPPAGGPGGGKQNKTKQNTLNADNYLSAISQNVCKTSIFVLFLFFYFYLGNIYAHTFQSSCTQLCCCSRQTSVWRIFLIPPKLLPRLCPKLPPRLPSNPNPNQVRRCFSTLKTLFWTGRNLDRNQEEER